MNLKYFAWIAEIIDKREESLEIPSGIVTIGQLIDYLSSIDEAYKKAFEKRKSIKFAVNQVLVDENELISKADEIAFFPPMTGG
tara:strand:+ start:285 stop:536 length:252 start_codon:yes stop_codon:yes gene_type:complete